MREGRSPLKIEFDVNEEHLARGSVWRLAVRNMGQPFSEQPVDFTVDLNFPQGGNP